jgi:hypothetical protein
MGCGVGFGRGENQVVDKSIGLAFVAAAHMAWYRYTEEVGVFSDATLATSRTEYCIKNRLPHYNSSQTYLDIAICLLSDIDLQRLATLSSRGIEAHEVYDFLVYAARWRGDACRRTAEEAGEQETR